MPEMKPDLGALYWKMTLMRRFELALASLWRRGLISGELHLGTGEEGIVAGVLDHLEQGDSLALDYRSTPPLVARGVDLISIVLELLGSASGLCRGMGGHMHLFSPGHLAASSGIVGASAPLAAGFAFAAQMAGEGGVSFSFFGEGTMNQGMVMESLNLAVAWRLPVVFVCKDNRLAITTRSREVTGGRLVARARSFGMPARSVDGARVEKVWRAAGRAVERARAGRGPSFILARCSHLDGHFLGDPLKRVFEDPVGQVKEIAPPLVSSAVGTPGASMLQRVKGMGGLSAAIAAMGASILTEKDPLEYAEKRLDPGVAQVMDGEANREVESAVSEALKTWEGERVGG